MKSNYNVGATQDQLPDDLQPFKFKQPNLGFSLESLADCFQVPVEDLWGTIHTHLDRRAAKTESADDSPSPRPLRLVPSRSRQRGKGRPHKAEEKAH